MNSQTADLRELIEEVCEELIEIGTRKPFKDREVVKVSQRLDRLMNEYEFLNQQIYLRHIMKGA